jgi:putative spermidine/putrescine transport system substrate-binding protein
LNFNRSDNSVFFDGGLAIDGYELPYNGAQCVFIYNKQLITSAAETTAIRTIAGLGTWLKSNPGKFTYAAPGVQADGKTGDYTGSAFIRHVFYSLSGPYTDFLQTTVNMDLYKSRAPKTFQFLRSLEPYLYKATVGVVTGVGASYPTLNDAVDRLFAQKRIALTLSYDAYYASKQAASTSPSSWNATDPQGYILDSGTIANTNYVAIPANSPNKLAAVVTANYLASPAAMFYRFKVVGALQVFDNTLDVFTTGGWNTPFDAIPTPAQVPPRSARVAGRLGELSGAYITQIQADWYKCVLQYAGPSSDSPQCG